MEVRRFEVGPLGNNVYVLVDTESQEAALVDPAIGSEHVLKQIEFEGFRLKYVLNTHGHFDHVAANAHFKERTGALLAIHAEDLPFLLNAVSAGQMWGFTVKPSPPPDLFLEDDQTLEIGSSSIKVIHTPGHSPGGVCLYWPGAAIVGDTIFAGSIGRTDLPGGSMDKLLSSVREKLFVLPDETIVYPGHGPTSSVGVEKQYNPFFVEG